MYFPRINNEDHNARSCVIRIKQESITTLIKYCDGQTIPSEHHLWCPEVDEWFPKWTDGRMDRWTLLEMFFCGG